MTRRMKPDAPLCKDCDRYNYTWPNGADGEDHYCHTSTDNKLDGVVESGNYTKMMRLCTKVRGTKRCKHIMPKEPFLLWLLNKFTGGA